MTEEDQELLRKRVAETNLELRSLSFKLRPLREEVEQLEQIYYHLFKFKESLERQLVKPRIIKVQTTSKSVTNRPLDEALKAVEKMSSEQIRALLAELQGSEEEGKEIEYVDEEEIYLIEESEKQEE